MSPRTMWFAGLAVWIGFALIFLLMLARLIPWKRRRPGVASGPRSDYVPPYVDPTPKSLAGIEQPLMSENETGARPGRLAVARDWYCPDHGNNAFSCCMKARRK